MVKICKYYEGCAFFKKYSEIMFKTCKEFIEEFCKGPKAADCKRRKFREKEGKAPPDDMLPV